VVAYLDPGGNAAEYSLWLVEHFSGSVERPQVLQDLVVVEGIAPASHDSEQVRIGRELFQRGVEFVRDLRPDIVLLGAGASSRVRVASCRLCCPCL
jgi:hypothetical protein